MRKNFDLRLFKTLINSKPKDEFTGHSEEAHIRGINPLGDYKFIFTHCFMFKTCLRNASYLVFM